MFIGHLGVGFGAKALAPQVSLGYLFVGAQFIDLIWPSLLLLGIETVQIVPGATTVTPLVFDHYPVSHSLLAVLAWALGVGLAYGLIKRSTKGAIVIGFLVVSHWGLDALVHQPDLPLYPGSEALVGLNIWDSLPMTLAVELAIFIGGLWYYTRTTHARDSKGGWGLWVLVAFLLIMYLGNIFGPPPPSVDAIAWGGQLQWLVVLWAFWLDKHRTTEALR